MVNTNKIGKNVVQKKQLELNNTIVSYATFVAAGYKLSSRLSFYFYAPKQLAELAKNLNLPEGKVANKVASSQIYPRIARFFDIYSLSDDVKAGALAQRYINDYYETYIVDFNGQLLLTTMYEFEHSRGFHRNCAILQELNRFGYPKCLPLISAVILNASKIKPATSNVFRYLNEILSMMSHFNLACANIATKLTCNIDVYETADIKVIDLIELIKSAVVNKSEFFKRNQILQSKFLNLINTAIALYDTNEKLFIMDGYCIGDIRWNNIFMLGRKAFIYDFSEAHYGNILQDYSRLITRLLLNQNSIEELLCWINKVDNPIFSKHLSGNNKTLRLKDLFIYCIIDILNIISEADLYYKDITDEESKKITIDLSQIDSIANLLLSLDVEFVPYKIHPEVMLSNGRITLYDFCNIHVTYLRRLLLIVETQEKKYKADQIMIQEAIKDIDQLYNTSFEAFSNTSQDLVEVTPERLETITIDLEEF